MNTKLITNLRIAATALETGTFDYDWQNPESCNCGVVACSITGKSQAALKAALPAIEKNPTWEHYIGLHCPVTGMPENEIFRALWEAGFTAKDLIDLERLRNPEALAKLQLGTKTVSEEHVQYRGWFRSPVITYTSIETPVKADYSKKSHVIKYLRAWADLLVEKGREDKAEVEPQEVEA